MLDRGKLAVLGMLGVALVAAGFAWWWNFDRGQRCLRFYGSEGALLVRTAKRVELLELAPQEPSTSPVGDQLTIDSRSYKIARRLDIGRAKGLIHARTSLVDDTAYRWDADLGDCQPDVRYAVRFGEGQAATLAFDFGCQRVWHLERGQSATLIPKVAEGWQSFLTRHALQRTP